jgi:ribosomal protein L3 glutamine methyltransferase
MTAEQTAHLRTDFVRTVRDLIRYAVSSFNRAELSFGHGTDNAFDEAAYLVLHSLRLPLDRLEPFLDAALSRGEIDAALALIHERVEKRLPAAYLTHEAWLGEFRFYVDERVIVPRSHIAELLREQLSPWITDPDALMPMPLSMRPTYQLTRSKWRGEM